MYLTPSFSQLEIFPSSYCTFPPLLTPEEYLSPTFLFITSVSITVPSSSLRTIVTVPVAAKVFIVKILKNNIDVNNNK